MEGAEYNQVEASVLKTVFSYTAVDHVCLDGCIFNNITFTSIILPFKHGA